MNIRNKTIVIKFLIFGAVFFLSGCTHYGELTFEAELPKKLDENSGIVATTENSYWLIEDAGNDDVIYNVNLQGDLLRSLKVKNAKNKDWEDLAKDEKGNIYIGDFGNNDNKRKDLVVYKIPNPDIEKGDKIEAEKIEFYYPEQQHFPPKKENFLYDAEAFFYDNDSLSVITKNRSIPFTGEAFIYKIPATKGKHKAKRIGKIKLCNDENTCRITAADISPDGKTIVLLSNGKLWVYRDVLQENFGKSEAEVVNLNIGTQLEAVCFKDANTLLLSDERSKSVGGNLYSYSLK